MQKKNLVNLKTQYQKLSKLKQREKRDSFLNEQSISEQWDNFKWPQVYIIGVPEERRELETKKIFEEIMTEIFPNLIKTVSPHTQEVQYTPSALRKLHQTTL